MKYSLNYSLFTIHAHAPQRRVDHGPCRAGSPHARSGPSVPLHDCARARLRGLVLALLRGPSRQRQPVRGGPATVGLPARRPGHHRPQRRLHRADGRLALDRRLPLLGTRLPAGPPPRRPLGPLPLTHTPKLADPGCTSNQDRGRDGIYWGLAHDDGAVLAAEAERVGDGVARVPGAGRASDDVGGELGVGDQGPLGLWDQPSVDGERQRRRLEATGGRTGMAGHALGGVERGAVLAEEVDGGVGLGLVVVLGPGAVGVDVAHLGRVDAGLPKCQRHASPHALAAGSRLDEVVAVHRVGPAQDLGVDVGATGRARVEGLQPQHGRALREDEALAVEVERTSDRLLGVDPKVEQAGRDRVELGVVGHERGLAATGVGHVGLAVADEPVGIGHRMGARGTAAGHAVGDALGAQVEGHVGRPGVAHGQHAREQVDALAAVLLEVEVALDGGAGPPVAGAHHDRHALGLVGRGPGVVVSQAGGGDGELGEQLGALHPSAIEVLAGIETDDATVRRTRFGRHQGIPELVLADAWDR